MTMGEVGDSIPNLDRGETPPEPDTTAISLTPEGTDLSDCAPPDPQSLELDISGIALAPEGSDVLDEEFRKRAADRGLAGDRNDADGADAGRIQRERIRHLAAGTRNRGDPHPRLEAGAGRRGSRCSRSCELPSPSRLCTP